MLYLILKLNKAWNRRIYIWFTISIPKLRLKCLTLECENCLCNFVRRLWFLKYWLNLFILWLVFMARDTRRPFGFDLIIVRNIFALQNNFRFNYVIFFLCRYKFFWTKDDVIISWHRLRRKIISYVTTHTLVHCDGRKMLICGRSIDIIPWYIWTQRKNRFGCVAVTYLLIISFCCTNFRLNDLLLIQAEYIDCFFFKKR